jgi:hypothetical protein
LGPHDRAGPRVAGLVPPLSPGRRAPLARAWCGLSAASLGARWASASRMATVRWVSTRKLIIAALLCGVAILVAGAILLLSAPSQTDVDRAPAPTTTSG